MLIGSKIGLRSMRAEDAWLLYKWYNDQRVTGDLGSRTLNIGIPLEEMNWKVEKALGSDSELHMIIVALVDQKAIGTVSLRGIDQRSAAAELRALIGEPSIWGLGYGKEAVAMMCDHGFNALNLHRIQLRVAEYNLRAIACFTSCGFEREGLLRDDHYHLGGYRSSVVMSLLREEREGQR